MKILHVLNTAGVASVIGKYMDHIFDTESHIVTRKRNDKYGLTTYGKYWNYNSLVFYEKLIYEAKKYDIIHLHDRDILLPPLRLMYPRKPLIIHYHGTKIRGQWNIRKKYWKYADEIIVVTKDLLKGAPSEVILVPNPVDKTLFYPQNKGNLHAIHFEYGVNEIAHKIAEKNNLPIFIHDRKKNPVLHKYMPKFLNKFTHLIDVRKDLHGNLLTPPYAMSKVALEALACDLKVIPYQGEIITKLPKYHEPEIVVEDIYEIYQSILSNRNVQYKKNKIRENIIIEDTEDLQEYQIHIT